VWQTWQSDGQRGLCWEKLSGSWFVAKTCWVDLDDYDDLVVIMIIIMMIIIYDDLLDDFIIFFQGSVLSKTP
jgi:hypothetical protein